MRAGFPRFWKMGLQTTHKPCTSPYKIDSGQIFIYATRRGDYAVKFLLEIFEETPDSLLVAESIRYESLRKVEEG